MYCWNLATSELAFTWIGLCCDAGVSRVAITGCSLLVSETGDRRDALLKVVPCVGALLWEAATGVGAATRPIELGSSRGHALGAKLVVAGLCHSDLVHARGMLSSRQPRGFPRPRLHSCIPRANCSHLNPVSCSGVSRNVLHYSRLHAVRSLECTGVESRWGVEHVRRCRRKRVIRVVASQPARDRSQVLVVQTPDRSQLLRSLLVIV